MRVRTQGDPYLGGGMSGGGWWPVLTLWLLLLYLYMVTSKRTMSLREDIPTEPLSLISFLSPLSPFFLSPCGVKP